MPSNPILMNIKYLAATLLSLSVLFYVGACAYLYFGQRALLYFPTPDVDVSNATVIALESDGATLRIWQLGPASENAVIYFGGNAEDVSQNIPSFIQAFPERSVYLVNYRGYGGSTGVPTEAGLFTDALAVFDFVQAKHTSVAVVGRSLGSGVAVYLATARDVKKLVLVTPYDSIENIARKQFPLFPISLLLQDKFTSSLRAKSITIPTRLILAENDEVIPRESSVALAAAFPPATATVNVVTGATHNSIGMSDDYWMLLRQFL